VALATISDQIVSANAFRNGTGGVTTMAKVMNVDKASLSVHLEAMFQ
jgi:hypothetical protein